VTKFHVMALVIAAALFLTCEISGKCSEKMIDHASQLAMTIAVATFAHAQGNRQAIQKQEDRGGDSK
jgi:putative effector of murein hydrolase